MNDSTDPSTATREALARLEAARSEGRRPQRHDARDLLIPLGRLILEGHPAAGEWTSRARRVTEPWGEAWRQAVASEQALACAEHIHSADARFLSLPNYDWAYTRAARERLEARLVASEALGLPVDETLRRGVEKADHTLAKHDSQGTGRARKPGFLPPEGGEKAARKGPAQDT